MKNFYLIILSFLIISCGGGSEESKLPDITITTSSSEAKDAYLESMKLYDLRRQVSVEKRKRGDGKREDSPTSPTTTTTNDDDDGNDDYRRNDRWLWTKRRTWGLP